MSLSSGSAKVIGDPVRITYQDEEILVVEKPAGIPTQPLHRPGLGPVASHHPNLAYQLSEQYPELKAVGGTDWGAVHRLDRETSGLVVFARNQKAYERLRSAFSKGLVEKEYRALVEGEVRSPGRIDFAIGPDPKSAKRVKVYRNVREARRNKAQEAVTLYSPFPPPHPPRHSTGHPLPQGERDTWLKIIIKTGRRHQIRAHLAAIGHPIVGDALYGRRIGAYGPTPLRLHATRLRFRHPTTNRPLEVASPFSEGSPGVP